MFGISSHRQIYEFSGIPHLFRKIYSRFGIDFVICRPNRTFSSSRAQSRTQFGLYRGEKTKNEIQRFRQAERRTERSSDSTEARKRRMKFNVFVKPSAEPNAVRAIPRREMEERNSTISSSRAQSRTKFGLYRGEKWSMQTNESARPTEVRRRLCYSIPSNRQMKRTATG